MFFPNFKELFYLYSKNCTVENKKIKFSVLEKNQSFKILVGKGIKGAEMQTHLANKDGFLMVQSGEIMFYINETKNYMGKDACMKIPMNVAHSFEVLETCEVLLILGADVKMKFVS